MRPSRHGGVFTWTPTEVTGSGHSYTFDVVVSDGTAHRLSRRSRSRSAKSTSRRFWAPSATERGRTTLLTFTATATDPDLPASLSFSLGRSGGGGDRSATGVFTWTPTEAQGPGEYTFDVGVSDGTLTDCETITVTVNEVNVPGAGRHRSADRTSDEQTAHLYRHADRCDLPAKR